MILHVQNCDPKEFEQLFEIYGYGGCIGSSDATHVGILKCTSWATIFHLGHKLIILSRTYNVTVSHSIQILGITFGHPATWNDDDELVSGVHTSLLFDKYEFKLYEHDKTGKIIEIPY